MNVYVSEEVMRPNSLGWTLFFAILKLLQIDAGKLGSQTHSLPVTRTYDKTA